MAKKKWGYLYILNCKNIYTIGVSRNVENRITQLTKMPYEIKCEYKKWVYNPYHVEKFFHETFEHKRVNGEWFNLDANDLRYITGMVENAL